VPSGQSLYPLRQPLGGGGGGATQTPLLQEYVAGQCAPHEPQLEGSLARAVSQPSACMSPLQSVHPAAHVPRHTPPRDVATQDGVTWFVEHLNPQPPQLFTSLPMFVSQPSDRLFPLQSA